MGDIQSVMMSAVQKRWHAFSATVLLGFLLAGCSFFGQLLGIEEESDDQSRLLAGGVLLLNPEGSRYLHLMLSGTLRNSGGTPLPNYTVSINPSAVTTSINYPLVASQNVTCPVTILNAAPNAVCATTSAQGFFIITFTQAIAASASSGKFSIPMDLYDSGGVRQGSVSMPVSYGGGTSCLSGTPSQSAAPGATVALQTLVPATLCTLPSARQISVVVLNTNIPNSNKSAPALPVELWATTTLAETPGFHTEKVKLAAVGASTYAGVLPLLDSGVRTVIVFDDVQTKPHPYGGTPVPAAGGSGFMNAGSGGHNLILTDDYFSPCGGKRVDGLSMTAGLVLGPQALGGASTPYIPGPRLPVQGSGGGAPTIVNFVNDEVYSLSTNQAGGSLVIADYLSFVKGSGAFCECTPTIRFRAWNGSVSHVPYSAAGYFTDTNQGATGGSCVVR